MDSSVMFAGLDSVVIDLQTRKTILIGSVGSGKSSLARYVSGDYSPSTDARLSGSSVTKGVKLYKGKYIGIPTPTPTSSTPTNENELTQTQLNEHIQTQVQYNFYDSEGFGSDQHSNDALRNQFFSMLKFETELNCVIIVASFERFRNGLKDDLNHSLNTIQTLGLAKEHTLVVFTHCETYKDEIREKYVKEFKEYYAFDFGDNYIFGCFANMEEVHDDFAPLMIQHVRSSITKVRNAIMKKKNPVNVARMIDEMEK